MRENGKVAKYREDQNYGFLRPDDGGKKDIFLHPKHYGAGRMPRQPKDGDAISYELGTDGKGPVALKWLFEAKPEAVLRNPRQFGVRRASRPQEYRAPQFGKNSD